MNVTLLWWSDGYGSTMLDGVYTDETFAKKVLADREADGKKGLSLETRPFADDALADLVKWCHLALASKAPEFVDPIDPDDADFVWRALCRITGENPDKPTTGEEG